MAMHLASILSDLYLRGKQHAPTPMDVTFSSAELAALRNSERRLADRWGLRPGARSGDGSSSCGPPTPNGAPAPWRVGRHNGTAETVIDFGAVTIRGQITTDRASGDRIVISSVDVQGSTHR